MAKDLEIVSRTKADVIALLEASSVFDADAAAAVSEQIHNRILAATTVEEIFEAANAGLEDAESLAGVPLEITGVRWNKSGIQDSPLPAYAVLTAVDANGVEHIIGTGGESVIYQLVRFFDAGVFADGAPPFRVIFNAKPTTNGYTVLILRPLTQAEQATFKA